MSYQSSLVRKHVEEFPTFLATINPNYYLSLLWFEFSAQAAVRVGGMRDTVPAATQHLLMSNRIDLLLLLLSLVHGSGLHLLPLWISAVAFAGLVGLVAKGWISLKVAYVGCAVVLAANLFVMALEVKALKSVLNTFDEEIFKFFQRLDQIDSIYPPNSSEKGNHLSREGNT